MGLSLLGFALLLVRVFADTTEAFIVILSGPFTADTTIDGFNSACQAQAGSSYQALVCANGRNWTSLIGLPLYSMSSSSPFFSERRRTTHSCQVGFCGYFPRLESIDY